MTKGFCLTFARKRSVRIFKTRLLTVSVLWKRQEADSHFNKGDKPIGLCEGTRHSKLRMKGSVCILH